MYSSDSISEGREIRKTCHYTHLPVYIYNCIREKNIICSKQSSSIISLTNTAITIIQHFRNDTSADLPKCNVIYEHVPKIEIQGIM